MICAVDRRHLDRLGQEEQRVELSAVPDDRLAGGRAEQREDRDLGVRPAGRRLPSAALRAACPPPSSSGTAATR